MKLDSVGGRVDGRENRYKGETRKVCLFFSLMHSFPFLVCSSLSPLASLITTNIKKAAIKIFKPIKAVSKTLRSFEV